MSVTDVQHNKRKPWSEYKIYSVWPFTKLFLKYIPLDQSKNITFMKTLW